MSIGKMVLLLIMFGLFGVLYGAIVKRPPAVAGMWYDGTEAGLRHQVDSMLAQAETRIHRTPGHPPVALIVPHAGYAYSGDTAAAGYAHLKGGSWKRVIVMGPAHRGWFHGASITPVDAYQTPLGLMMLDKEACKALSKNKIFVNEPNAHVQEHDLECQVPFLQTLLPQATLIPILVGDLQAGDFDTLATALAPLLDDRTLLVVSSDFTHYGPNFGFTPFQEDVPSNLKQWADEAGSRIVALDFDGFMRHCVETKDTICGRNPIGVAIKMLQQLARKKHVEGKILEFTTSGAITHDWRNSVSYMSILFSDPPATETPKPGAAEAGPEFHLTPAEKDTLLRIARDTLTKYLADKSMPAIGPPEYVLTPTLRTPCGAFVTLTESGNLRGCIGYVLAVAPLYRAVSEMAVNAAVRDPRFRPVQWTELKDIAIEISVLSPLSPCTDFRKVKVGKHGLLIRQGGRSGLLLPQVPVEWGWDRDEFLRQVCHKAGLPPDAYKAADAELFTFTAEVFHEKH
jgi:AmmeMemoRadiSam system protein B/AmmeMemoRadiSam system protein A